MIRLLAVLVLAGASLNAQIITETFGAGANSFSIEFVTIANPGNPADTTGDPNPVGRVDYIYNLGKYEISRGMIEKANATGALGITLADLTPFGGNGSQKPASGISWLEAAKFVNWLNTGSGFVSAYQFDVGGNFQAWSPGQSGFQAKNPLRNKFSKYFLPDADEWYKGAYGSPDGTWYNFPNGSDTAPNAVSAGSFGAVFEGQAGPADIHSAGSLSAMGTMAQGGNVWEWTESSFNSLVSYRETRGGSWGTLRGTSVLESSSRDVGNISLEDESIGFRVAMVPEPSSLSLIIAGGAVLMAGRRRNS